MPFGAKAAASVIERHLRGLKRFADVSEGRMRLGVVLYDGTETLALGADFVAAPISTLWGG